MIYDANFRNYFFNIFEHCFYAPFGLPFFKVTSQRKLMNTDLISSVYEFKSYILKIKYLERTSVNHITQEDRRSNNMSAWLLNREIGILQKVK